MAGLFLFGVIRAGTGAIAVSRAAAATLRDPDADDDTKEKAARAASIALFGALAQILGRAALALLLSALPIALAHWTGLATAEAVTGFMARWDVIIIATLVITAGWIAWKKLWPTS